VVGDLLSRVALGVLDELVVRNRQCTVDEVLSPRCRLLALASGSRSYLLALADRSLFGPCQLARNHDRDGVGGVAALMASTPKVLRFIQVDAPRPVAVGTHRNLLAIYHQRRSQSRRAAKDDTRARRPYGRANNNSGETASVAQPAAIGGSACSAIASSTESAPARPEQELTPGLGGLLVRPAVS
jgi:hypothetical protein